MRKASEQMNSKELMERAVKILDTKKASDIRVLDIHDITVLGDYFVIASGTSTTQVKSLADEVEFQLKEQGVQPMRTQGYESATWIVLDYADVIVHVFLKETRDFYSLEHVWRDGKEVDLTPILEEK